MILKPHCVLHLPCMYIRAGSLKVSQIALCMYIQYIGTRVPLIRKLRRQMRQISRVLVHEGASTFAALGSGSFARYVVAGAIFVYLVPI